MKVKLSIIIPHYDTYDLTYKLLKELSIQKTKEVEIIVIDDSQEKRLDVFKTIAYVIHNQGRTNISIARNQGINMAQGKYIAFIDSDDMITMDYIETLLNAIDNQEEDIIFFNWVDVNRNILYRKPSNPAVWKAIYKKEICPKFNESDSFNEDLYFQEEIKKGCYEHFYIDRVLYLYNSDRVGSLSWKNEHND